MSENYGIKQGLKTYLNRLGVLDFVATPFRIKWILRHWHCNIMSTRRMHGYDDKQFSQIRGYANVYRGKRCFIVCTGPSLAVDDVDNLKNEYSFSMNSIMKLFDKTDWRPSFYVIEDADSYLKLKSDIANCGLDIVFAPDFLLKEVGFCREVIPFPMDILNHAKSGYRLAPKYNFSDNAYAIVYNGFTVTFVIIQLAVYMGFKEIYLLGCDCNYGGNKMHFEDYHATLQYAPDDQEQKMISAFTMAKKYADEHGIKIYNATRGGKLEVFERVNFDEVIKERRK